MGSLLLCLLELGLLLFLLWGVEGHVGFPPGVGARLLAGARVDLGDELLVHQVVGVEVHLPVYPRLAVEDTQQIVELTAGAYGPVILVKELLTLLLGEVADICILELLVVVAELLVYL